MRFDWMFFFAVGALAGPVNHNIRSRQTPSSMLPLRTVAQFAENNTWLDNITIRRNGDLIVTENVSGANLYTVRKPWNKNNELILLHQLEDADGALGVVEPIPNYFVIATTKVENGNFKAKSVTLQYVRLNKDGRVASAGFVGRYPGIGLINGMTNLGDRQNSVLAADSVLGVIYKFNPFTGEHVVALDVPELKVSDSNAILPLGVNGVKIYGSHLYWTNTNTVTVYRIAITKEGFPVRGAKVQVVSRIPGATTIDDLAIDAEGNVWVAGLLDNNVVVIKTDGSVAVEVGGKDDLAVAGNTALAFGRTARDSRILYATTNGGMYAPVNGTLIEPGKVAAIDTSSFYR